MQRLGRLLACCYGAAALSGGAAWSAGLVSWPLAVVLAWIGGAVATMIAAVLWTRISPVHETAADPDDGVMSDDFVAALAAWERDRLAVEPQRERASA